MLGDTSKRGEDLKRPPWQTDKLMLPFDLKRQVHLFSSWQVAAFGRCPSVPKRLLRSECQQRRAEEIPAMWNSLGQSYMQNPSAGTI